MQSFVSQWHKCMSKDDFIFHIPAWNKTFECPAAYEYQHNLLLFIGSLSHLLNHNFPISSFVVFFFFLLPKFIVIDSEWKRNCVQWKKLWKIIFHLKWYSGNPDFYCFFHCLIHLKLLVECERYEKIKKNWEGTEGWTIANLGIE